VHFAFLADEPLPDQRDAAPVAPTRSGIGNLGSYERGANWTGCKGRCKRRRVLEP